MRKCNERNQSPAGRCSCTEAALRAAEVRTARRDVATAGPFDGRGDAFRIVPMIGQGSPAPRVLALGQEVLQDALHPLEIRQLRFDLGEPFPGDAPDGNPIGAVLELQKLADFFQGEAQFLGPLDESNALDQAQRVVPEGAVARRDRQQLSVLVVADGLDAHVGRTCEPADRERVRCG